MEIISQFGMASGNLGYDFLKFLVLLPIAIIIDLAIKTIKNRSKKDDSEIDNERTSKQEKSDIDEGGGDDEDEDDCEDDEDGLNTE